MHATLNRRQFATGMAGTVAVGVGTSTASAQTDSIPGTHWGLDSASNKKVSRVIREYIKKYDVPGLSLAIARHGRLAVVTTFGWANKERKEKVQPHHRFRVASVSKPITSATLMKLIEQRKLRLSSRIFGDGGILKSLVDGALPEDATAQRRLNRITVQHLLEHTCGGWGNKSNDPMFSGAGLDKNHPDLIRWCVETRPLENDPGTKYSYSNFGYCLLGRVIEKVTGKGYADVVQSLMARPAGSSSFAIGGNTPVSAGSKEVTYYGQNENAYHRVMNVSRMDAHGGWIATPIDLVRFVLRVDGFRSRPDLLSSSSIAQMTTPSSVNRYYAKGWSVNKNNNWWHMGGFNGGASIIARINDGFAWAATVNTRSKNGSFSSDLDQLMWKVRNGVGRWSGRDLFSTFS